MYNIIKILNNKKGSVSIIILPIILFFMLLIIYSGTLIYAKVQLMKDVKVQAQQTLTKELGVLDRTIIQSHRNSSDSTILHGSDGSDAVETFEVDIEQYIDNLASNLETKRTGDTIIYEKDGKIIYKVKDIDVTTEYKRSLKGIVTYKIELPFYVWNKVLTTVTFDVQVSPQKKEKYLE